MVIDLRSDTLTLPTNEMREAMAKAEVGDDVWGEDPTVKELEAAAALKVGKEAALFMASGTMGNQVAAMTHLRERGNEVIAESNSHIYYYEVGGLAVLSNAQVRTVVGNKGILALEQVRAAIRSKDIHFPKTGLLCLENTHNRAGGTVMTPEQTRTLCDAAHDAGVPVHLDGARIFNASVSLGIDVQELTSPVDSIMFCLSKGLGAPVGSMLAGTRDFIDRARKNRKMLGGGMRQVGVLAAAGLVALNTMIDRLREDHELAFQLARNLANLSGISLDMSTVQTNIVVFDVSATGMTADQFVERLARRDILTSSFGPTLVRMVVHKDIPRNASDSVAQEVEHMLQLS